MKKGSWHTIPLHRTLHYTGRMLKMMRLIFPFILCFAFGGSLIAQPQLLPGQQQRQSLSGGLIFRCLFDKTSDAEDNDGWPDYWTQKKGSDNGIAFPDRPNIGIAENSNPFGNYALRMNIDGGGAAAYSPKIPIRGGMSYTVSAFADTTTLVHNEIFVVAAFYGKDSVQPIRTVESKKIRNTNGWQQLAIGPIPADISNVTSIAVGLYVVPTTRQDFNARVHFTNVEIRESPTISLEMANPQHLFFTTRELSVQCHFRGLDPAQHSVSFLLEDHSGRVIGQRTEADLMIGNHPAARFVITSQNAEEVIVGTATWQNLPVLYPGFYRIRVATPESYIQTLRLPVDETFDDPLSHTEPLTFAVMSPGAFRPGGEFGWTLDGWTLDEIADSMPTLAQSGLSHLKLPVWLSAETTPQHRDALIRLCNTFSEQQVNMIGLLNPVPESIRSKISHGQINAASILGADPKLWGDGLQPTLRTLSLLVKDWQWTSDTDQSLIDMFFDPDGKMSSAGMLRFQAFQKLFDQDEFGFGIGMTWNWYQDIPDGQFPFPNVFINFPIDDSVTPERAATTLAGMSSAPFRRSVSVTPLHADHYSLETRIIDFVRSLVLLKAAGMDSIFLTAPKDDQIGILRHDGTPNELYLPWRTTATLLTGSRLLGSITLPNRSPNYCFDMGGGRCVMVVWNDWATPDQPVIETLYLGREPEVIDVWGRQTPPEQLGNAQTISVSQTPKFVTGLNIDVAKFRLSMQTHENIISAVPNRTHTIPFTYRNDAALPVTYQIMPQGPRAGDWTITPPSQTSNLESGFVGEGAFDLTLLPRADTGHRPFHYHVRQTGTETVEFDVYDEMMVGNPDVFMEFTSRLNENGDIEVVQVFINNSDKAYTYRCRLTVRDRPTVPFVITRQGFGRAEHVYVIRNGQALIDSGVTEMMLRATAVPETDGEPMVYTIPLIGE